MYFPLFCPTGSGVRKSQEIREVCGGWQHTSVFPPQCQQYPPASDLSLSPASRTDQVTVSAAGWSLGPSFIIPY